MAKGDGWAVKRYKCPRCNRKGLYYRGMNNPPYDFTCMYKNCSSHNPDAKFITNTEAREFNKIPEGESIKYKP